jgi:hypothetical protein
MNKLFLSRIQYYEFFEKPLKKAAYGIGGFRGQNFLMEIVKL